MEVLAEAKERQFPNHGDTIMKWVKFLKDDEGRKANEVVQIEDNEYPILKRLAVVEDHAEPAEVAAQATNIAGSLKTFVESTIETRLAEAIADLTPKGVVSKRPRITTHDNVLDDPKCGFKTEGEFLKAVRNACAKSDFDERLKVSQKANGASEDINADGGYAVPVEYASTVFDDVLRQDSLLNDCFTIPMTSNSIKLPAINYLTQGQYGITANWEGEGQTIPTSKPKYRQPALTLNKLTALCPVTSELLEDGLAVEALINKLAAEAITYKINDAIINGTGAGQPIGIVGHGSTVVVTRDTTVTVKADDVLTMRARLYSNNGGKFYINKDVEPSLLQIQDPGGRYLYFAPGSFAAVPGVGGSISSAASNGRLLGFEVRPLYNCQTVGTSGDIILANLKDNYVLGYKASGVNKAMSIHLYFNTDEVAYRWTFRVDGRPWRDTTLAAAHGTAVYGTAVTLSTK